jgi:peptidoglycan hydrolase-like protein with peptidoglycan-binding domain
MIPVRTGARSSVKLRTMKRGIAYFVVALLVVSSVRADQTIQSVQQALKDQGFYYGNVTGDKSAETTAAIRRYQIRNGLQVTGEIDSETLRSLKPNSGSPSHYTSKYAATQPRDPRSAESPRLEPNPSPPSFGEPDRWVEMNRSFVGRPFEWSQSSPSRRMVAEAQRQLMSRGYYRGSIDGRYGPRTAFALQTFQSSAGIPPTAHFDTTTLDALGLPPRSLAYLDSAPQPAERWVLVKKFKHGKWKVKWKKYHGHRGDKDDEDKEGNGDGGLYRHGDDD